MLRDDVSNWYPKKSDSPLEKKRKMGWVFTSLSPLPVAISYNVYRPQRHMNNPTRCEIVW